MLINVARLTKNVSRCWELLYLWSRIPYFASE